MRGVSRKYSRKYIYCANGAEGRHTTTRMSSVYDIDGEAGNGGHGEALQGGEAATTATIVHPHTIEGKSLRYQIRACNSQDADRLRIDRKSTRLNSSHSGESRMPSSA